MLRSYLKSVSQGLSLLALNSSHVQLHQAHKSHGWVFYSSPLSFIQAFEDFIAAVLHHALPTGEESFRTAPFLVQGVASGWDHSPYGP